jgi:hypothetical protein
MLKVPEMKVGDCTCLLCGSQLELKINEVIIGDNRGACPMCQEPFTINITKNEMKEFKKAEKN